MRRETISIVESERYEQGVKATIKRIQAENTRLRHHYGELEQRVLQLKKDIAAFSDRRHQDQQIPRRHRQKGTQDKEQQMNANTRTISTMPSNSNPST